MTIISDIAMSGTPVSEGSKYFSYPREVMFTT